MTDKYVLEGRTVRKATNLIEWAKWFEASGEERRVASTKKDGIHVSTVFLGLDHSFGIGEPLLFETMIFGGKHDEYQERCTTWTEAEEMHKRSCQKAFGA